MQEKKNCPELIRIFAQKIRIKDRFFKFLATRTNEMFGIPWNINGFSGSQGLQRNYVLSFIMLFAQDKFIFMNRSSILLASLKRVWYNKN